MRPKLLLWIAPWIALGLGACATLPPQSADSKACAEWRWIGIKSQPDDECPQIPDWNDEPLFPSLAAAQLKRAEANHYGQEKKRLLTAVPDPQVVRELQRFCVYKPERKWGRPSPPAPTGKLVRIDQDCAAIAVAGDTDGFTDWGSYSRRFLEQAGQAEALEIKNRQGVRLAFLDTHPTQIGVPAEPPKEKLSSEHGYTLAHIARNLICSREDSSVCAALITTRLALPITKFNARRENGTKTDTKHGGRIGLQSDLAEAIRAEVDDWAKALEEQEDAPQRLVLNLSVAWDGARFGGLKGQQLADLRAGTQAVYWALRYAAGFDVLVLAAAGNRMAGCPSVGALLPAAWEQEAPEICGEPPSPTLVYAVGGIDSMGKPLANARDEAMPPRVAYGASAVVPALSGNSTTKFTGTSVSTAVASSIAAIVWDTLPEESPDEVMSLLYRSGDNLGEERTPLLADFGLVAGVAARPLPVHRLSLCPAVKAACLENRSGCPLRELECAGWTRVANLPAPPPPLGSCHPWVHTQPPFEPCPVCEPPRE